MKKLNVIKLLKFLYRGISLVLLIVLVLQVHHLEKTTQQMDEFELHNAILDLDMQIHKLSLTHNNK